MSHTYSDRVMRFRRGVYGARGVVTAGCQVLLLRLSDSMDAKAIVSVPRSQLAREFDCAPARITEWITAAKEAGFLSVVRRARPGTTAVYQGLVVLSRGTRDRTSEVRGGVPLLEVRKTEPDQVREGVPQNGAQRYARAVPQVEVAAATIGTVGDGSPPRRGSYEEHDPKRAASNPTESGWPT